jgi:hypothetical protein
MSIDKPVVWVAFVTVNLGDHDEFSDFLSVHSTQENAKAAVDEWVKDLYADEIEFAWVEDPNDDSIVRLSQKGVTYEQVCAGQAFIYGDVQAREIDP